MFEILTFLRFQDFEELENLRILKIFKILKSSKYENPKILSDNEYFPLSRLDYKVSWGLSALFE